MVSVPSYTDRVNRLSKNFVALYLDYFKVELHVPICELLYDILRYYRIHIFQLTLNDVHRVISFEILCNSEDRVSSIRLFRYFFQMKVSQCWFSFSTTWPT